MFFCFFIIFAKSVLLEACYIAGTDSGVCSTDTLSPDWRAENMPYCGARINYPACLPVSQSMPPSREFPNGRWLNHTVQKKDEWVRDTCLAHIAQQIGYEKNTSLSSRNVDIYGHVGQIKKRFDHNRDCRNAFANYFCFINFPRCDPATDESLPTCLSACKNLFKACGYENNLVRCGEARFFNGYFAEKPPYYREYFPGQPFKANKFKPDKLSQYPICTPAIMGGAGQLVQFSFFALLAACLIGFLALFQ